MDSLIIIKELTTKLMNFCLKSIFNLLEEKEER